MRWLALTASLLLAFAASADDAGVPARDVAPDAGVPEPDRNPSPWAPVVPEAVPPHDPARARALYDRHCRACHGRGGGGNGPVAHTLSIRPRDLTLGVFKVRSTPSGSVPTDFDLFATVTLGLGGSMPGWSGLPAHDRWQLVQMVKSFSPRFEREPARQALAVATPTGGDAGRGRGLYVRLRCAECHGEDGRGVGTASPALTDDQQRAAPMPNLRRAEVFRAGCSPEALQKTLLTGFDGTPMPAYESALGPGDARDLVAFLRSWLARPEHCRR